MIWIYIAIAVTLIAIVINTYDEGLFGFFFGFIVFGVMTSVLALFLNGICAGAATKTEWRAYDTFKLKNIQQTSDIHGRSYFLGSGYIDSNPAFYYYKETGENRYVLDNVDSSSAEIIEVGADVDPHVDVQRSYDVKKTKFWSVFGPDQYPDYFYTFYIPKGSVSNSFSLGPDTKAAG